MDRRRFLHAGLGIVGATALSGAARGAAAASAVEAAHGELWRRFIDPHGVMIDFTALDGSVSTPTPEECRAGKPNALGWYQPLENGPMFTGMYLDAIVNRWRHTQAPADAAKARRLMEGLLFLSSLSDVKGFIARGASTDGRSHYPMGSDDQTLPWFLGLWRYLESGLATAVERERIAARLVEVADVIERLGWHLPAEPPFGRRGSFAEFRFDPAVRLLFVARMLHAVSGEARWDNVYRQALSQRGGEENLSRLALCERGMVFWYARTHNWTSCSSVAALRALWELESDASLKAAYARGLAASADLAAQSLPLANEFDPHDDSTFSIDWRTPMMPLWKPQRTAQEAQELASRQLREFRKASPRQGKETAFVREPASAAWIVALAADSSQVRRHSDEIERVIGRYDCTRLHYSTFFWVESAWWRLADLR